jgi:hypothetical protein
MKTTGASHALTDGSAMLMCGKSTPASIGKLLLPEMLGVLTSNSTLIYRLLRFVSVRVISWILFGRVKRIHEITRNHTK